jgi:hypothetical protein
MAPKCKAYVTGHQMEYGLELGIIEGQIMVIVHSEYKYCKSKAIPVSGRGGL